MPIGTHCAKPHCVCLSRLGTTDSSRPSDRTNHLSSQTWLMGGLFETTTQNTGDTNDPGVSPTIVLSGLGFLANERRKGK